VTAAGSNWRWGATREKQEMLPASSGCLAEVKR
jgi:hypothetical protein